MNEPCPRVVYDCNVFVQGILNAGSAAGRCIELARTREVELLLSEPVLLELRDIPGKRVGIRHCITSTIVERLLTELLRCATFVPTIPEIFTHPIDPDDSCYVNLALSANANLIVSRDRHLLGLVDTSKPWSAEFRRRFPHLRILTAVEFCREFESRRQG